MSEEAKERRCNSTAAFILSNEVFEKNSHFTAIILKPTYLYVAGGKAGRKQKERCPRGKEDTIMNNKIVGAIFCLIAAILAGARYVAAAIFMSSTSTWSAELFQNSLNYVGPNLLIAAIVALVAGIGFLVCGLLKDGKKADK